jgi:hypothetical protein
MRQDDAYERKRDCENKNDDNHVTGQVSSCNYLGYTVAITNNRDVEIRMNRFS